jgi:uncharacterized protein (DUF58 family)
VNSGRWLLALALVVAGALAGVPGLALAGVLIVLTSLLTELWSRFGLRRVRYQRTLARDRAVWGDEIPLDVSVWNDKPLPLAWLAVDDFVTEGASMGGAVVEPSDRPGLSVLHSVWTVGWFERVVRHLRIRADHRGTYELGPVKVTVADLFGRGAATEEHVDRTTYIVRPRSVPVRHEGSEQISMGTLRARQSLFEDPSLFAGVRPYQPGDSQRRIHWRATARVGMPVTKRFDPSRARDVLIALDVQTVPGPHWALHFDEPLLESLIVAAASLARQAIAEGAAVGLTAAAYTRTIERTVYLPTSGGQDQLARIADVLGRLSQTPSAPFELVLSALPQRLAQGTTVLVVSGRDPGPLLPVLRRLDASGYPVEYVALGPLAAAAATRVRGTGLVARLATLSPDWKTSDALVLAG